MQRELVYEEHLLHPKMSPPSFCEKQKQGVDSAYLISIVVYLHASYISGPETSVTLQNDQGEAPG